jgi:hypothetical protein
MSIFPLSQSISPPCLSRRANTSSENNGHLECHKSKNQKEERIHHQDTVLPNLDKSCNKIDNQCGKIHDVQETLNLVVRNDIRDQANKKGKIQSTMVTQIKAISKSINTCPHHLQLKLQFIPPKAQLVNANDKCR